MLQVGYKIMWKSPLEFYFCFENKCGNYWLLVLYIQIRCSYRPKLTVSTNEEFKLFIKKLFNSSHELINFIQDN